MLNAVDLSATEFPRLAEEIDPIGNSYWVSFSNNPNVLITVRVCSQSNEDFFVGEVVEFIIDDQREINQASIGDVVVKIDDEILVKREHLMVSGINFS